MSVRRLEGPVSPPHTTPKAAPKSQIQHRAIMSFFRFIPLLFSFIVSEYAYSIFLPPVLHFFHRIA